MPTRPRKTILKKDKTKERKTKTKQRTQQNSGIVTRKIR